MTDIPSCVSTAAEVVVQAVNAGGVAPELLLEIDNVRATESFKKLVDTVTKKLGDAENASAVISSLTAADRPQPTLLTAAELSAAVADVSALEALLESVPPLQAASAAKLVFNAIAEHALPADGSAEPEDALKKYEELLKTFAGETTSIMAGYLQGFDEYVVKSRLSAGAVSDVLDYLFGEDVIVKDAVAEFFESGQPSVDFKAKASEFYEHLIGNEVSA